MRSWSTRNGNGCLVHEFRPEGWDPDEKPEAVVIQRPDGCVPRRGGKTLAGHWPGQIGAARKAVTDSYRQHTHPNKEKPVGDTSKAQLAERARIAQLENETARLQYETAKLNSGKAPVAPAPTPSQSRHGYNFDAQASNWDLYGNHKTEPDTFVRKVKGTGQNGRPYVYTAILNGRPVGTAKGRYGNATRSAAKRMVTNAINAR